MNYYEELGIDRDATISEIREAYKLAARLLHPDLQQDQRLKELADREMKRLGGVVAVLVDPRARARYNAELGDGACLMPPVPLARAGRPEFLQTVVRHWFWVLLGSTTIGMGTWYAFARSTTFLVRRPRWRARGRRPGRRQPRLDNCLQKGGL